MAVENMQGDAKSRPPTSIEKHRQEQAKQEVEHGHTSRSFSKTSLHSFSHTFPLFALLKSTPSSLAITSSDP
jgi:hypothetical protein